MISKYKAFIFDLDGTLLNSLIDISESVNLILSQYNLPQHSIDAYKYFVGNGIKVLAEKSLPEDFDMNHFPDFLSKVEKEYMSRQTLKTHPYNGIMEMLKELNNRNIPISILSNKPHEFTEIVVDHFFLEVEFKYIFGAREDVPRKPNPASVYEIINLIGLPKSEFAFVGDTATDIQTGLNAGLDSIGVSWGFRTINELEETGATSIINNPTELLDFV